MLLPTIRASQYFVYQHLLTDVFFHLTAAHFTGNYFPTAQEYEGNSENYECRMLYMNMNNSNCFSESGGKSSVASYGKELEEMDLDRQTLSYVSLHLA